MSDSTLLLLRDIMMESVVGRCSVWFAVAKSKEKLLVHPGKTSRIWGHRLPPAESSSSWRPALQLWNITVKKHYNILTVSVDITSPSRI